MGLVVEHEGVGVTAAELDHLRERCGVAAHRIDAVDDDRLARLGRQFVEDAGETLDVVVPEALHGGAGELGAGEQRVVGVLVEDHDVVAVEQAADGADVGHVPGGEHQGRFSLVELGQLGLERPVEVEGSVEEP